jgi:hypothetical protein
MNRTPGYELEKPVGEVKTPEQLAAEKKAADDKAAADAAAAAKTPEQLAAEKKAADDKAAADAAAKAAQGEPNPLDKLGPLPVETLAKVINDNPTLAAELEKAGVDPQLLYDTSRMAAVGEQMTEIYPTVEAAKFAAANAENFYKIEQGFPTVNTIEDLDKFITDTMLPMSVLYDATSGEPLKNPDGSYQTDGSIGRFFSATSQMETVMGVRAVEKLIEQAATLTGEEGDAARETAERIKDALILAQEFRVNGYRLPGKKPAAPTQRSPEDQRAIDEAARIRAEADTRTEQARQAELKTFDDGVMNDTTTATGAYLSNVLNRTTLTDYDKSSIAEKVNEKAWEALANNRHFQAQKAHLQSMAATPENRKALVTLAKTGFEREAFKLLQTEIARAGGKIITRQQQRTEKQETQQANDRMNRGTGTTATPKGATPLTGAALRDQAIKNLKAAGNKYPEDGDILTESLRLRKATLPA